MLDVCSWCGCEPAEDRFNGFCVACFIVDQAKKLRIVERIRAIDNVLSVDARKALSGIIDDLAQLHDDTVALDCCGVTLEPGETQCRGCQQQSALDDATDRAIDDAKEAQSCR